MRPHSENTWQTNVILQRASRFAVVGVIGTLIDLTIFTLLHLTFNVPVLVANTISYGAGIINNFILHRRWTWADCHQTLGTQFSQFIAISIGAWILNDTIVAYFGPLFNSAYIHSGYGELFAKVCATLVSMGWNFFANNFWTFRLASQRINK
jgi:putative flippase GtrA